MERSTVLIWRAGLHLSIRKIVEYSSHYGIETSKQLHVHG